MEEFSVKESTEAIDTSQILRDHLDVLGRSLLNFPWQSLLHGDSLFFLLVVVASFNKLPQFKVFGVQDRIREECPILVFVLLVVLDAHTFENFSMFLLLMHYFVQNLILIILSLILQFFF